MEFEPAEVVGVSEVVAAVSEEFITNIPTEPSIIGRVAAALFTRCILILQFTMVLLEAPSLNVLLNKPIPYSTVSGFVVFPSLSVSPSSVIKSAPERFNIPSGDVLAGVAVPTPAFNVTVPPLVLMVTLLTALKTGFSVALPIVKPFGGHVSLPPDAHVKITGPDIAVVALSATKAFARDV